MLKKAILLEKPVLLLANICANIKLLKNCVTRITIDECVLLREKVLIK